MKSRKGKDLLREFLNTFQIDLSSSLMSACPGSSRAFAIERQLVRMRKRAQLGSDQSLKSKAATKFLEINEEMANMELKLTSQEIAEASDFISNCLWRYMSFLDEDAFQCSITSQVILDNWRHGPGASNGMKGTHTAEKLDTPWTVTRRALPYVIDIRRSNPYLAAFDGYSGLGLRLINGSRLTFVPKNEDSVRTIAIEPGGNMCVQLAVGRHLEEALRFTGLDISTQSEKNKRLARQGSLDGTLATLDLSSASDRIHPSLVRALFPESLYSLLMSIRSPVATLKGHGEVHLNMISTMGNGTTFPVMTLLICGLIYASKRINFGQRRRNFLDWSSTGVFGDDIIVKQEEVPYLVDLLTRAGLVVNSDKSYSEGPFRESCGGDYYDGTDVTPVYVKRLRREDELYVVTNRLLSWCSAHNVDLPRTWALIKNHLPKDPCFVPEWMPIESGIRTLESPRTYHYLRLTAVRARLRSMYFACMLAAGGYLETSGGRKAGYPLYVPRETKQYATRKKGQLPKGWLTGWDPLLRDYRTSGVVATVIGDYLS